VSLKIHPVVNVRRIVKYREQVEEEFEKGRFEEKI